MNHPPTPSALQKARELAEQIEKSVFDCCDAVQNALGKLDPTRSDGEASAIEYLKEWTPKWMWEETFTVNEIPERLGTAAIYAELEKVTAERDALKKEHRIMKEELQNLSKLSGRVPDAARNILTKITL